MDHNDGGLEDHFPFQMGDGCRWTMLIFQGVCFFEHLCHVGHPLFLPVAGLRFFFGFGVVKVQEKLEEELVFPWRWGDLPGISGHHLASALGLSIKKRAVGNPCNEPWENRDCAIVNCVSLIIEPCPRMQTQASVHLPQIKMPLHLCK